VSDIKTAMVDSLKVLDPRRPIREADIISPKLREEIAEGFGNGQLVLAHH
jgi:hypothetical protein